MKEKKINAHHEHHDRLKKRGIRRMPVYVQDSSHKRKHAPPKNRQQQILFVT